VPAKLQLSSADTVYFQPDVKFQQEKSIVISPSLLNVHDYATYLQIYNPTERTRTLFMNSLIGHVTHTPSHIESFYALDSSLCQPSVLPSTISLNTITSSNNMTLPQQVIEQLFDHIHNPSNKQHLRVVLQNNISVFDSGGCGY
jgi:hypothetical protein